MIKKTLTLEYGGDFDGRILDLLISEEEIQERVKQIARQISADYEGKSKPPIMIGVLNGSFYFMADLLRAMSIEAEMDFIKISSYHKISSSGTIRLIKDISADISKRDVILVEDIIDTGLSINYLRNHFLNSHPASVRVVALLYKRSITKVDVEPEYVGFEIPDKFVVGYGLDIDQQYRRLRDIFAMDMHKKP
ncbi:MAG: hypoxanthine phosphoribosyltransferase [Candidatus Marinimicrobia bacterium]|jgi:hypoxanthine phosphoribosyltransferase|nr:hypoxanthine phosphoribosyltransferase [Candidatus Neomarinimicrobiota bacterium]MDD4961012.1 hypoxanthine phosphoribosyltransferase [Candidatus Neomarinimicrobiota bacterium]MDD5709245.1 hypoxanthine phosphoribosyltransferase [Candidatus Neomarinimicrobiota bacterium]MDX9777229.1 hypoxanthine phosphoribosyltransferase [bacterium]